MAGTSLPSATTSRRYAAKVEKGENAWRREWSGFMSGVSLKDLRKGGGVSLPKSGDLGAMASAGSGEGCTYSYLFSSAADKKAERLAKKQEEAEKRKMRAQQSQCANDPLAHLSKHERTLEEAKQRGLKVDGMTRKEIRQFLNLTISKEQQEAEKRLQEEEFKPHKLMDEKLQWYQQGPHPIDIIAEKLVMRKAIKKGKQLGLRYNYLLPHPSWVARRERRRRETPLIGLGKRFIFDDEGNMLDNFGTCHEAPEAFPQTGEENETTQHGESGSHDQKSLLASTQQRQRASEPTTLCTSTLDAVAVLVDPREVSRSFVRAVVRNRDAAIAIKNANLTTSYINSSLIKGPSIGVEDAEKEEGEKRGAANSLLKRPRLNSTDGRKVVPHKRSKAASFEP
ncbi:uncharacterized protein TEOVI_000780300 [Trypanosoma equiperdum]|uniref:Uncharacterized protein n=2 Tax=Trypanozoon TaxID=39700 RepID=Q386C1_TRYB2|nr:hypothetical protein, conserved [Trypanosoma brucei brucei TREU927]EAN79360.1 hypothetical protein, conserved [Trypanosoma brucei brucei TREU927]SCU66625.1 hypothetical protein, conserved [Trypanosoma equiperdum]